MIEFYGTQTSLTKWRKLVKRTIGKLGHHICQKNGRYCFEISLSKEERQVIQNKLWHAESGTGHLATGHPFLWNDCIGYLEK